MVADQIAGRRVSLLREACRFVRMPGEDYRDKVISPGLSVQGLGLSNTRRRFQFMRTLLTALILAVGMPVLGLAQGGPAPDKPRPISIRDSVFIENLTWMEVRDLIADGKDTAIVASGGVEQNGPYLVTGKHNVLLRGCDRSDRPGSRERARGPDSETGARG